MGFAVVFGLLLIVSGWWLYSRWAALRDAQAQRREAEMMMIFEARSKRVPASEPTIASQDTRPAAGDFRETLPGSRR